MKTDERNMREALDAAVEHASRAREALVFALGVAAINPDGSQESADLRSDLLDLIRDARSIGNRASKLMPPQTDR